MTSEDPNSKNLFEGLQYRFQLQIIPSSFHTINSMEIHCNYESILYLGMYSHVPLGVEETWSTPFSPLYLLMLNFKH